MPTLVTVRHLKEKIDVSLIYYSVLTENLQAHFIALPKLGWPIGNKAATLRFTITRLQVSLFTSNQMALL